MEMRYGSRDGQGLLAASQAVIAAASSSPVHRPRPTTTMRCAEQIRSLGTGRHGLSAKMVVVAATKERASDQACTQRVAHSRGYAAPCLQFLVPVMM